jgi:hypothetical protein
MTDPAEHQPSPALEYHRPVALLDRVVARLRVEHLAVTLAFCGFAIAHLFGGPRYRSDLARHLAGSFGLLMLLGCTLWYVVLRVRSRKLMPGWLRVQLVAATILCLCGVFVTISLAQQAREGPRGLRYWLTYNQTYAYNPVRVARSGRVVGAGVAWFATVLAADRIRRM